MNAAETAAWKLAGIGQDIVTEARVIALDVKRGDPVSVRAARCRKLIANAEKVLAILSAELQHKEAETWIS
jgi:hypothetical protein